MEKLRDEILQAERNRSELLKWKLGLVGTIGAAGLGLAGLAATPHHLQQADLVLSAIPLVAVYVDLLSLHLTLRILVIGSFLERSTDTPIEPEQVYREYELFTHQARELPEREPEPSPDLSSDPVAKAERPRPMSAFDLEDWALRYSTYGLSAAVGAYGVLRLAQSSLLGLVFLISSATGLIATFVGQRQYVSRCRRVAGLRV